jgi:hypothetical protein
MSGSSKGSKFERDMARAFSRWASGGESEDWFWRTAGSGARQTTRQRKSKSVNKYDCGDMTYALPEGQRFVENVNYEFRFRAKLEVLSCFYPTDYKYSLAGFWAKACMEADQSDRMPLLVTKVNRGVPIIWMPDMEFGDTVLPSRVLQGGSLRVSLPASVKIDKTHKHEFLLCSSNVVGVPLDMFFSSVRPRDFLRAAEDCAETFWRFR